MPLVIRALAVQVKGPRNMKDISLNSTAIIASNITQYVPPIPIPSALLLTGFSLAIFIPNLPYYISEEKEEGIDIDTRHNTDCHPDTDDVVYFTPTYLNGTLARDTHGRSGLFSITTSWFLTYPKTVRHAPFTSTLPIATFIFPQTLGPITFKHHHSSNAATNNVHKNTTTKPPTVNRHSRTISNTGYVFFTFSSTKSRTVRGTAAP